MVIVGVGVEKRLPLLGKCLPGVHPDGDGSRFQEDPMTEPLQQAHVVLGRALCNAIGAQLRYVVALVSGC